MPDGHLRAVFSLGIVIAGEKVFFFPAFPYLHYSKLMVSRQTYNIQAVSVHTEAVALLWQNTTITSTTR